MPHFHEVPSPVGGVLPPSIALLAQSFKQERKHTAAPLSTCKTETKEAKRGECLLPIRPPWVSHPGRRGQDLDLCGRAGRAHPREVAKAPTSMNKRLTVFVHLHIVHIGTRLEQVGTQRGKETDEYARGGEGRRGGIFVFLLTRLHAPFGKGEPAVDRHRHRHRHGGY